MARLKRPRQGLLRRSVEDLYNLGSVRLASSAMQGVWRAGVGRVPGTGRLPQRITPFCGDFPHTGLAEALAASKVLLGRRLSAARGHQVERFEREMARLLGVPHAVACSSGTSALTLAFAALGIGQGDEVIVPAVSYVSTAMCVLHVGALPVFADVTLPSGNLDVSDAARRVSDRTRAIVAVHLDGVPADLPALRSLCVQRDLHLIEDAAQALGSSLGGTPLGTYGDVGCFSFNAGKQMTTGGEGGLVVTGERPTHRRCQLAVHVGEAYPDGTPLYADRAGQDPDRLIEGLGWNLKMTEVQAAIGRVQARRLERLVERRRHNGNYLAHALAGIQGVVIPSVLPEADVSWWRFPVQVLPGTSRDVVLAGMRQHGITAYAPDYGVLALQPVFERTGIPCPRAEQWHEQTILLPTHPSLSRSELRDVAPALRRVLREERRG